MKTLMQSLLMIAVIKEKLLQKKMNSTKCVSILKNINFILIQKSQKSKNYATYVVDTLALW